MPQAAGREGAPAQSVHRAFVVSFFVFALLVGAWALPLVMHANSRVLGGPADATGTIRDYWSMEHQEKNPFNFRVDKLVGAPEGLPFMPGTQIANAVQPLFVWTMKDAIGLVAAWNMFVLLGIALTGATTFALLTMLGLRPTAAAFGAYAFAASGYLVNSAYGGHAGLVQAWVFPLLLMVLLRANRSDSVLPAALAGLVAALGFYLHTYYGAFAFFLLVVFFGFTAYANRRVERPQKSLRRLAAAIGPLVVALLPAVIALHHFKTQVVNGGPHPLASLQSAGARIPAYFAPSTWSPLGRLIPSHLEARLVYSGEASLFFGFTTIALSAAWLWWSRDPGNAGDRTRFVTRLATVLVLAAFVASLPRLFAIGPVHLPAPSWFIGHVSTVLRVYARFGLLVGLGLVILASFAVDHLERTRSRRWAVACVLLLALELTPTLPAKSWIADRPPASDRWLASHPGGEVAIYPLENDEKPTHQLQLAEYYFQRFHAHPLFSAVSPSMSRQALALRVVSQYFTVPWTPHVLAAERVKYVVIRTDVYRQLGQAPPILDTRDFRLLATLSDARIYRVLATPVNLAGFFRTHGADLAQGAGQTPPSDNFTSGFYAAEQYKYNVPWRWLQQNGRVTVNIPVGDTALELKALAFSNGEPRTLQIYGPGDRLVGSAKVATSLAPLTIGPFDAKPGRSTFTFHVTPGPQALGGSDPRVASVYLSQPVFQPILKLNG